MKKLIHVLKGDDDKLDFADVPMKKVGGDESRCYEVEQVDLDAVHEGTKDFFIDEHGFIQTKDSTRKAEADAEKEAKEAERLEKETIFTNLKPKLVDKTATLEEIQEALNKLI